METLRLKITGMSCGHCVAAVRRALAVPGVKVKSVEVGAAEAEYDPARIQPAEILRRIGEEGYTAEAV